MLYLESLKSSAALPSTPIGPKFYTNKPILGPDEASSSVYILALAFQGDAVPSLRNWHLSLFTVPYSSLEIASHLSSTWATKARPFFPHPTFSKRGHLAPFSCSSWKKHKTALADWSAYWTTLKHRGGRRRTGAKGWRDSQESVTVHQLSSAWSGVNTIPKHTLVVRSTKIGSCLSGSGRTIDLHGKFVQRYQKYRTQQLLSSSWRQQCPATEQWLQVKSWTKAVIQESQGMCADLYRRVIISKKKTNQNPLKQASATTKAGFGTAYSTARSKEPLYLEKHS